MFSQEKNILKHSVTSLQLDNIHRTAKVCTLF